MGHRGRKEWAVDLVHGWSVGSMVVMSFRISVALLPSPDVRISAVVEIHSEAGRRHSLTE